VRGVDHFYNVKPIIWGWLDAWDAGRHVALVKAVEEANLESWWWWRWHTLAVGEFYLDGE
jgi:hypothetical protein